MANQTVTLAFIAETEAARRRVKRLEDAVDDLGDEMNDVDSRRFRRETDRASDSSKRLDKGLSGVIRRMLTLNFIMKSMKFLGIYTGIRLLLPLISALGAASFALVSSMGSLLGLIGLYPAAASAAVSAFGALKFATMGLSESLGVLMADEADPEALAKALKETGPQVQKFAGIMKALRRETKGVRREAQESLFGGINKGLEALEKSGFLTTVINHFVRMNKVIGDIAAGFGGMLGSSGVLRSLGVILRNNENTVRTFGRVLTMLAEVLTHVIAAAQPLVNRVMRAMEERTTSLLDRVRRAVQDGTLQRFFTDGFEAARRMAAFLGSVWRGLVNVNDVLSRSGLRDRFITPFEDAATAFERYSESLEGQADILRWFERSADVMDSFYLLLGRFREVLRGLGDEGAAAETTAYFFNQLAAAEGPIDRLFSGLGSLDLRNLVDMFIDILNAVADLATMLPMLEPLLEIFAQVARGVSWLTEQFAKLPEPVRTVIGQAMALVVAFSALQTLALAIAGGRVFGALSTALLHIGRGFMFIVSWGVRLFTIVGRVVLPAIIAGLKALAAMAMAHPIIAVVVLLIGLFVLLWTRSERFREVVTNAFNAVLDAARRAWTWITENWRLLTAALGPVGWLINHIVNNFDAVRAAAMRAWDWIRNNWQTLLAHFSPFLAIVVAIVSNFHAIRTAVTDAMSAVRAEFASAVEFIRGLPGVDLVINAVTAGAGITADIARRVTGVDGGGDTSAQRGALGGRGGRGLGATLAMHAAVDRATPGRRTITNATVGRWGGSDHHKGRALDLTGSFMGAYARNLAAMGGASERHGQGSSPHTHAVFPVGAGSGGSAGEGGASGDTMRNLLPALSGGGGGDIVISGPLIGTLVANKDIDVENATYRALERIVRERRERA